MAKLMWIAGILLVAAGVALGLMIFFSPASIISWGMTADTATLLLVGGILSLGLGSVIDGLGAVAAARPAPAESAYAPSAIPAFGRKAAETTTVAAAAVTVEEAVETVSPQVKETIDALEQATQDLKQAFDEKPVSAPPPPAAAEPVQAKLLPEPEPEPEAEEAPVEDQATADADEPAEEEAVDDGQLYVVEERTIRSRPARILSDGTVEAETDEGWMRFENLEHLDEYLDAMAPASRA